MQRHRQRRVNALPALEEQAEGITPKREGSDPNNLPGRPRPVRPFYVPPGTPMPGLPNNHHVQRLRLPPADPNPRVGSMLNLAPSLRVAHLPVNTPATYFPRFGVKKQYTSQVGTRLDISDAPKGSKYLQKASPQREWREMIQRQNPVVRRPRPDLDSVQPTYYRANIFDPYPYGKLHPWHAPGYKPLPIGGYTSPPPPFPSFSWEKKKNDNDVCFSNRDDDGDIDMLDASPPHPAAPQDPFSQPMEFPIEVEHEMTDVWPHGHSLQSPEFESLPTPAPQTPLESRKRAIDEVDDPQQGSNWSPEDIEMTDADVIPPFREIVSAHIHACSSLILTSLSQEDPFGLHQPAMPPVFNLPELSHDAQQPTAPVELAPPLAPPVEPEVRHEAGWGMAREIAFFKGVWTYGMKPVYEYIAKPGAKLTWWLGKKGTCFAYRQSCKLANTAKRRVVDYRNHRQQIQIQQHQRRRRPASPEGTRRVGIASPNVPHTQRWLEEREAEYRRLRGTARDQRDERFLQEAMRDAAQSPSNRAVDEQIIDGSIIPPRSLENMVDTGTVASQTVDDTPCPSTRVGPRRAPGTPAPKKKKNLATKSPRKDHRPLKPTDGNARLPNRQAFKKTALPSNKHILAAKKLSPINIGRDSSKQLPSSPLAAAPSKRTSSSGDLRIIRRGRLVNDEDKRRNVEILSQWGMTEEQLSRQEAINAQLSQSSLPSHLSQPEENRVSIPSKRVEQLRSQAEPDIVRSPLLRAEEENRLQAECNRIPSPFLRAAENPLPHAIPQPEENRVSTLPSPPPVLQPGDAVPTSAPENAVPTTALEETAPARVPEENMAPITAPEEPSNSAPAPEENRVPATLSPADIPEDVFGGFCPPELINEYTSQPPLENWLDLEESLLQEATTSVATEIPLPPSSEVSEVEPESEEEIEEQPSGPFIKPLSAEWEARVDSGAVATTLRGDSLTRRDLATCSAPLAWLNDEVINAYLEHIIDSARRAAGNNGRNVQPKYHGFNSFFYSNLRDKGYDSVRRWATRAKIGGPALLGVDTVLIPIHNSMHWTLLVVKPSARTVEYFDSLGGRASPHIGRVMAWLRAELGDLFAPAEWKVLPGVSPQQNNGSDCGVFLLTTAKLVALGLPLNYSAGDIPTIRRRIVGELMNGGFDGEFDPRVEFCGWGAF